MSESKDIQNALTCVQHGGHIGSSCNVLDDEEEFAKCYEQT